MSAYRPEFEAALRLFARASEAMHRRGFPRSTGTGARELFRLQTSLDRAYLDRRIKEETAGDYGIESLS